MSGARVVGVDACAAGWVGIVLSPAGIAAHVHAEIGALVDEAAAGGTLDVIGIDIPIGLPDDGPRRTDLEARIAAGPRRASVFITPVRATLGSSDHAHASQLNRQRAGQGISRQTFNLLGKINQVDQWLSKAPCRVLEVHPELSFGAMAGAPLAVRKATWAGALARRRLLAAEGIVLPDELGPAGHRAGMDDVLDAAAVAWTARRFVEGRARRLPAKPEMFSDQIECAIWT